MKIKLFGGVIGLILGIFLTIFSTGYVVKKKMDLTLNLEIKKVNLQKIATLANQNIHESFKVAEGVSFECQEKTPDLCLLSINRKPGH